MGFVTLPSSRQAKLAITRLPFAITMPPQHILLVEDEAPIREMLRFALEREHFGVSEAGDVASARVAIAAQLPDLILLDWMLPQVSGVNYLRELKASELTRELPVIMVTARGAEEERIRGLNLGCDDYICKPFSTAELLARVRALLRRAAPMDECISINGLRLDLGSQRAMAGEQVIALGPAEFRLLRFFMSHPERVYSRAQMLDRVWGQNVYVEERTVDVHVRRLRKALAPFALEQMIQTVRGSGYRFSSQGA